MDVAEEFFNELHRAGAAQPETADEQAARDQWLAGPLDTDDHLDAAYATAVADNPHYPYDSVEEHDAMRARRARRLDS